MVKDNGKQEAQEGEKGKWQQAFSTEMDGQCKEQFGHDEGCNEPRGLTKQNARGNLAHAHFALVEKEFRYGKQQCKDEIRQEQ